MLQQDNQEPELLISVKRAAKRLDMSASQVYALCASGQLPSIRISGSVRLPVAELSQWIEDKMKAADDSWGRGNSAANAGYGGLR